jgi:hypothetical protein
MDENVNIRDPDVLVKLFHERLQWCYTKAQRSRLFSQALSAWPDMTPQQRANWLRIALSNLVIPEAYEIVDYYKVGDLEIIDHEFSDIVKRIQALSQGNGDPFQP